MGHYDNGQKFPAFGFGGKFFGNPQVSHCVILNGNPNDPQIETIDGILKAYREVLKIICTLFIKDNKKLKIK